MAPKLFILGATGYVGGDFLYVVNQAHPEWEITCMVRNSDKGSKVAAQYPKVRLVYGDLDSTDLIAEEAAKADIICTMADCDHVASANAIAHGLQKKTTPTFVIHTSGTGILTWETTDQKAYGRALPRVYNDFEGIGDLTSLPDHAPHRNVDKIVLSYNANSHGLVHTAIVAPPTIYGLGRGPDNIDSIQVPLVARTILQHGEGFSVRDSENIWCKIHVHDLSNLYLRLAESAASALSSSPVGSGEPATWDEEGYYLCEAGTFVWADVISRLTSIAHEKYGLVKSSAVRALEVDDVNAINPYFIGAVGGNSIGDAIRARKLLGWEPTATEKLDLMDTLDEVLQKEGKKLGLIKGHGEVVAEEVKF